jgi:hypothetical protein
MTEKNSCNYDELVKQVKTNYRLSDMAKGIASEHREQVTRAISSAEEACLASKEHRTKTEDAMEELTDTLSSEASEGVSIWLESIKDRSPENQLQALETLYGLAFETVQDRHSATDFKAVCIEYCRLYRRKIEELRRKHDLVPSAKNVRKPKLKIRRF